jgi:uncharacterized protein YrrD
MKRSIMSLTGHSLKGTDGEIGEVDEFYFDDVSWTIRYMVVKTGNWLSGRKVLISPKALIQPDWENENFPVNLTKEQIKNSPDIDTDKPVSRQNEEELSSYYTWDNYWGGERHGAGIFGSMPSQLYESGNSEPENIDHSAEETQSNNDPHLQSTDAIKGYTIHATDGEIGKVVDYILDDSNWKIDYLVVDTGNWLNSKKVLLATSWITQVKWDNELVVVNVTTNEVKNCPAYDSSEPINATGEKNLFDYYGRPQPKK